MRRTASEGRRQHPIADGELILLPAIADYMDGAMCAGRLQRVVPLARVGS